MKEAAETFLETVSTFGENIQATEEGVNWIAGERFAHVLLL